MNRAHRRAKESNSRKTAKTHDAFANRITAGLNTLRALASLESGVPAQFVGVAVEGEAVRIWDRRVATVALRPLAVEEPPALVVDEVDAKGWEAGPGHAGGTLHFTPTFNDKVREAARLLDRVDPYGATHIVSDDGNLEDDNIRSCYGEDCTADDIALLDLLLTMSEDERETAYAIANRHIKVPVEGGAA